jgi:hypothetical protein
MEKNMNEVNPKVKQVVSELGQNDADNRAVLGSGSSDGSHDWFREMSKVYDFENHPLASINVTWWKKHTKIDNQHPLYPLACHLIFRTEIDSCRESQDLSLRELQNHCYQLAKTLRNHATSDLVQTVRKQLENSPYQSLLGISPSSPYTDIYISSLQTSLEVMRQYSRHRSIRIPYHPIEEDFAVDIQWGEVDLIASEPAQEPFENMNIYGVADVRLKFVGASFGGPEWANDADNRAVLGSGSSDCSAV